MTVSTGEPELISGQQTSMGCVVHRFDSMCIGRFGAGIVEDIIKFVIPQINSRTSSSKLTNWNRPGVIDNRQVVVCSAMKIGGGADRNMTRQYGYTESM
jgi:hypothetical protein